MDVNAEITRRRIQPELKTLYAAVMLILAIDTALDACAAAVLDTSAGGVIAQESQAMKRGHAEALMPLIARVMKASGVAFAAPIVSENDEPHPVLAAIDARHDHVYFQMVGGDASSLIKPQVAPIAEALDAARFGALYLVGNAAGILADRWPTDAAPPIKVDQQAAPDIAWVAWLGAAVSPESSPARPYYLRAPDAKPPKDPLSGAARPTAS